jgi:hypothetical protein
MRKDMSDQFNDRVIIVDHANNVVAGYGNLNNPGSAMPAQSLSMVSPAVCEASNECADD